MEPVHGIKILNFKKKLKSLAVTQTWPHALSSPFVISGQTDGNPNLETNLHLTALADGTEITLHVHSRTALEPHKSQHLSNTMANFMKPVFARNLWSLVAFCEILATNKILTIPPAASSSPT